ncbi:conserved hypothetical protein, partial [delta proteobacterium NaphS2]
ASDARLPWDWTLNSFPLISARSPEKPDDDFVRP